mmetsp:Transcript_20676/g.57119  ORF Transcript_20676/g.57119 Transcript_20676/m.57119 type:complete len:270 (+) Transcript_20676:3-812(+)
MLDVGGKQSVAVLRRTLTQFEDSMLAAKFSGRWDDSLEKDSDGRFFIDQDPANFQLLLSFLRDRANTNGSELEPKIHIKSPTLSFCSMVRYYQLMPFVFPMEWTVADGTAKCEGKTIQSTKFMTETKSGVISLLASPHHSLTISKFSVSVPWNAKVGIGWMNNSHGVNSHIGDTGYSFGVRLEEKQFRSGGSPANTFAVDEDCRDPSLIECNWDTVASFTIRIAGNVDPPVTHTFSVNGGGSSYYPAISFSEASIPIMVSIMDYVYPKE